MKLFGLYWYWDCIDIADIGCCILLVLGGKGLYCSSVLELLEIVSFDQKMFQKIVPPIQVHQKLSAGVNGGPSIGYSVCRPRSEDPISTSGNLGL